MGSGFNSSHNIHRVKPVIFKLAVKTFLTNIIHPEWSEVSVKKHKDIKAGDSGVRLKMFLLNCIYS